MPTLSANWKKTVQRAGFEPRVVMRIDDNTTTWEFMNDVADNVTADLGLIRIDTVSAEHDPEKHRTQSSGLTATIADARIRSIVVNNRLKGAKVDVWFGAKDTAHTNFTTPTTDFVQIFTGVVDDVAPQEGGLTVLVSCLDSFSFLAEAKIKGAWFDEHPLEVAEDIISNKLGLAAALIDADKFDPSYSANSENAHLVVWRAQPGNPGNAPDLTVWNKTSAAQLISELMEIVNGGLYVTEKGELTVKIFDASAASVADWDTSTIQELRQIETDSNIVNNVTVGLGVPNKAAITLGSGGGGLTMQMDFLYEQNDTDSQSDHAAGLVTSRIFTRSVLNPWIVGGPGRIKTGTNSSATTMEIWLGYGVAGTRSHIPTGSQPNDAKPTSSNPVYLGIFDQRGDLKEIIKITTAMPLDFPATNVYLDPVTSPPTQTTITTAASVSATVARGQLGTTGKTTIALTDTVVDMTAAFFISTNILDRFADGGAPKIEVDLPLAEMAPSLGDLVTVTWPRYLAFGADGITSSTKWEVIGKDIDIFGSNPHITYTLMRATENAQTKSHDAWATALKDSGDVARRSAVDYLYTGMAIVDGFEVTKSSGLISSTAPGVATNTLMVSELTHAATFTHTASKDTYVYFDAVLGKVIYREEALSSTQPTTVLGNILLAKVITDGTEITTVTDLRQNTGGAVGADVTNTDAMSSSTEVPNGDFGINISF